jgi:Ala-tRNA(Pro) deacylase
MSGRGKAADRTEEEAMPIPRSIEHFLGDQHVPYSVLHHRAAYTSQEEAAITHIPGRQWAKTVACFADDQPILAVVSASSLVDVDRLRPLTGAQEVRLASEREFEVLFPDCETGAMPPLGPLYGQPVFVDRSLVDAGEIVFNAGSHSDAIKMRYDDFARVVKPTVGEFSFVRRSPSTH